MSYLFRSGTLQLSSSDVEVKVVEVKVVHLIGNDLQHLGYLENLLGSAFPSLLARTQFLYTVPSVPAQNGSLCPHFSFLLGSPRSSLELQCCTPDSDGNILSEPAVRQCCKSPLIICALLPAEGRKLQGEQSGKLQWEQSGRTYLCGTNDQCTAQTQGWKPLLIWPTPTVLHSFLLLLRRLRCRWRFCA